MGYWKETVVPKFKKIFEKNSVKKAAAAEACKSFDDSKEEYNKVFEEKKGELETKVVEIYEASTADIKALIKEPKEAALKKLSSGVEKFLQELSKIEFPGSKPAHEACSKYGAPLVPGPIFFVFEKVSTCIPVVVEEKKEEETPAAATEEATSSKEKEIVVEEEKKEEVVVETEKPPEAAVEKVEEAAPTEAAEPPKAC